MCGIAGAFRLDGTPADPAQVRIMLARLTHRGPDGQGEWVAGPVCFGHTRLAIIDLAGSAQPMADASGRVLTYNGEVFNYRALRAELGGPWSTAGDTEVMHRLLASHDPTALQRVHGQFAAAFWDPTAGRLTLARDAMGVLPLYWTTNGTVLLFASEVDALRAAMDPAPTIDRASLSHYLAYRAVPAPGTLWRGIRKLQPGHTLVTSVGGEPVESPWVAEPPALDHGLGFEAAVRGAAERIEKAVDLALEADVPVGAYLSGGLDSSLICALVRKLRPDVPLHTYCAVFTHGDRNEGEWADLVGRTLGTRHTQVLVKEDDFAGSWGSLCRFRGAPVSEPADIALHALARRASQDVKVVLSGEGADELLAGYPKYAYARATAAAGAVPTRLRRKLFTDLARHLPARGRRLGVALRALAQDDVDARIRAWFASFTPAERAELLDERPAEPEVGSAGLPTLIRMLRYDQRIWLPDNLLERGDRMTMAASIELRPPYLDPEVVRFARSLPPSVLRHQGQSKAVLKAVADPLLPEQIRTRPKAGFPVPLASWFRGDLREMARELLLTPGSFVAGQLRIDLVRALLDRHESGAYDESIRIWTLMSLEIWGREVARQPLTT